MKRQLIVRQGRVFLKGNHWVEFLADQGAPKALLGDHLSFKSQDSRKRG